ASADPGRRREHDNPRDECGHAGIQQDFVENSNHSTLSHTRLPLRAAALGHSPAHWTAKCYEFDNKEVRNGTKKRIVPRCAPKADIASLPRACPFTAKAQDMRCNEYSILFTWPVRASRRSGKVMPVSRASMSGFPPLSIRPTSMPAGDTIRHQL